MIFLHVIILLFFQSKTPVLLKKMPKKSAPIHVELVSVNKENNSKNTSKSRKKSEVDNKKIAHKKKNSDKNKIIEKTVKVKAEKSKEKSVKNTVKKETIKIDANKQEVIKNKEKTSDEIIENLIAKAESYEKNHNHLANQNTSQLIEKNNIDEENENENESEDDENENETKNKSEKKNLENNKHENKNNENENNKNENGNNKNLAGFEKIYRNQFNQKSIDINAENSKDNLTETPVFDDILYVSTIQAEQHLIEPQPPQLPPKLSNNRQTWQVVVTLYVDKHGNVLTQPKPFIKPLQSSGNPLIDENALQYVTLLRFQPFVKHDRAVVAEIELLVKYK